MDEIWFERYCQQAYAALDCDKAGKDAFKDYLRAACMTILAERPNAGPAELEALLGTPEQLAADFLDTLPTSTVSGWRIRQKRQQHLLILLAVVIVIVLLMVVAFYLVTKGMIQVPGKTTYIYYSSLSKKHGLRVDL